MKTLLLILIPFFAQAQFFKPLPRVFASVEPRWEIRPIVSLSALEVGKEVKYFDSAAAGFSFQKLTIKDERWTCKYSISVLILNSAHPAMTFGVLNNKLVFGVGYNESIFGIIGFGINFNN